MRVVSSLLLVFAAMVFSTAARASDNTPFTPVYFVADAQGPGPGFYSGFFERFTRFQDVGWLSLTHALYTFHNEGSQGYRSLNNLSPGFKPGFYLKASVDGTLLGRFSLWSWDKVYKKDGQGFSIGDRRVSFFVGPELKEAFEHVRGAIAPAADNAGSRLLPDLRVRWGVTWRFN